MANLLYSLCIYMFQLYDALVRTYLGVAILVDGDVSSYSGIW